MNQLSLKSLAGSYRIYRFSPELKLPSELLNLPEFTISKTPHELSVLVPTEAEVGTGAEHTSEILVGFRVKGTLDHNLIGILAKLSQILAAATIPIFAISTFDTDYIYIDQELREQAELALTKAGYEFV